MYIYESLEVLTKASLVTLAEYNDVPDVNKRMKKGEIIEAILEYMKPKEVVENSPPMSVRVRRIKESQERK